MNKAIFLLILLVVTTLAGWLLYQRKTPFFLGFALEGYPLSHEQIQQTAKEIGWQPQCITFYLQWPAPGQPFLFPKESLELIWQAGAVPCLTWEPMFIQEGKEVSIFFSQVLQGNYDSYLQFFATQARDWKKPLIIRLAHEMNLERYHWGTDKDAYSFSSAELYQKTFRYIVKLFKDNQASNVLWAFNPNVESIPLYFDHPSQPHSLSSYYPGDNDVDIIGLDGYNWGNTQTMEKNQWTSSWKSFEEIFYPAYHELKELAPDKPFFIFETASVGGDSPNEKQRWFREAVQTCQKWHILCLVWFQVNKEQDWRLLDSSLPSTKEDDTLTLQQWALKRLSSS